MTGRKKRYSVLAVILLLLLLSVQCSRRKQTEQKEEEAVTITWYVAKEGYSKEWNPKDNLADATILKNTG